MTVTTAEPILLPPAVFHLAIQAATSSADMTVVLPFVLSSCRVTVCFTNTVRAIAGQVCVLHVCDDVCPLVYGHAYPP